VSDRFDDGDGKLSSLRHLSNLTRGSNTL
jgi:hypothetical protein